MDVCEILQKERRLFCCYRSPWSRVVLADVVVVVLVRTALLRWNDCYFFPRDRVSPSTRIRFSLIHVQVTLTFLGSRAVRTLRRFYHKKVPNCPTIPDENLSTYLNNSRTQADRDFSYRCNQTPRSRQTFLCIRSPNPKNLQWKKLGTSSQIFFFAHYEPLFSSKQLLTVRKYMENWRKYS